MSDLLILIVEISAYLLALVVFGYFVYQVFFNDHARDEYKRKVETARVRRIDRRSKERPERRKKRAGPPEGMPDRRRGDRRDKR